ncbi:hypothetical protein Fcan01_20346 [Folsomia candida]|uniref:Uncharacterized protein n=1 Tax=Folsomia candida TaxID=158441 RepID=A0A226DKP4_FOLCA|nr:hypothetical protein Fcan01_20346 [Folsomia candida]
MAKKHPVTPHISGPPIPDFVDAITTYESCLGHAITIPAQEIAARTSEELELCLHFVSSGCTIFLEEATYTCNIDLRVDHVAIVGRGAKTVIDLCRDNSIEISANHCTLSNLKVAFSSFGSSVISLRGSQNEINDIEVTHYLNVPVVSQDASFWDIIIEGSHNILQRVKINCSIFENFYIVVTKYATNVVISDLLVTKGRVECIKKGMFCSTVKLEGDLQDTVGVCCKGLSCKPVAISDSAGSCQ